MKTALQELIEKFDTAIEALEKEKSFLTASGVINSKILAMSLLEKEKEQIIEAARWMPKPFENIEFLPELGNEYYNQKYNQNE